MLHSILNRRMSATASEKHLSEVPQHYLADLESYVSNDWHSLSRSQQNFRPANPAFQHCAFVLNILQVAHLAGFTTAY
jgi:hypothetical protein